MAAVREGGGADRAWAPGSKRKTAASALNASTVKFRVHALLFSYSQNQPGNFGGRPPSTLNSSNSWTSQLLCAHEKQLVPEGRSWRIMRIHIPWLSYCKPSRTWTRIRSPHFSRCGYPLGTRVPNAVIVVRFCKIVGLRSFACSSKRPPHGTQDLT